MTQATDHFETARARSRAEGFAAPRLIRLESLIVALIARGMAADNPRVPRYLEPLFGGPQAGSGAPAVATRGGDDYGGSEPAPPVPRPEPERSLVRPVLGGAVLVAFAIFAVSDRAKPESIIIMDVEPKGGGPGGGNDELPTAIPDIALYLLNPSVLIGLALIAILALAWPWLRRWWEARRRHQLRRDPLADRSALVAVATRAGKARLFADPGLGDALRKLRRHRATPSTRIDVRRSIRATIARGRVPTLRFARRRLSPDYVLLSERERPHDHLAEVAGAWRERLEEAKIACEHYEFHGDPNTLRRVSGSAAGGRERLDAVLARHEGADLVVLLESFDALAAPDAAPQWLRRAGQAARPHQMNPRAPQYWSRLEAQLEALGLPAFPATVAGTAQLADRIGRSIDDEAASGGPLRTPAQPDLAAFLAANRALVLSPEEPTAGQIASIVDTLERWLDRDAYDWLRALAVFPTVNGGFTFLAGCVLKDETLVTHDRYLTLARLPWLRVGFMPDWLRLALLKTLAPEALARAGATAAAFLQPPPGAPDRAGQLLELRRAAETDPATRQRLADQLARGGNPGFNDRLLIEVLGGRPPDLLGVVLEGDLGAPPPPQWWQHKGVQSALAGALGAGLLLAAQPQAWQKGAGVVQVGSVPGEPVAEPRPAATASPAAEASPSPTDDATVVPVFTPAPNPSATSTAPPPNAITGTSATLDLRYWYPEQSARAKLASKQLLNLNLAGVRFLIRERRSLDSASVEDQLRCFDTSGCAVAALLMPRLRSIGVNASLVRFDPQAFGDVRLASANQLELWFGGGTPNPDPEPTPSPTPPMPEPGPQTGTIVFFDWDSTSLTPRTQLQLDQVAKDYAAVLGYVVMISGHTDNGRSKEYDQGLTLRQANAVRNYLAERGVPDSAMVVQGFGSTRPLVETKPGVREPQNRRVEISLVRPPTAN